MKFFWLDFEYGEKYSIGGRNAEEGRRRRRHFVVYHSEQAWDFLKEQKVKEIKKRKRP